MEGRTEPSSFINLIKKQCFSGQAQWVETQQYSALAKPLTQSNATVLHQPLTKEPCFEENTAYYGNNHKFGHENRLKTRLDCQKSCESNSECNFWTFYNPKGPWNHQMPGFLGYCYLKRKRENVTPDSVGYVSGSKYCQLPEAKNGMILKNRIFSISKTSPAISISK